MKEMSKVEFRKLVVRAIEDAIILTGICICIAGGCAALSILFRWLGVA